MLQDVLAAGRSACQESSFAQAFIVCCLALQAGSVASDVERQYTAEPFNGDTLEDGSIFSSDESDDEDQVKWQKLFRRRVTVCSSFRHTLPARLAA